VHAPPYSVGLDVQDASLFLSLDVCVYVMHVANGARRLIIIKLNGAMLIVCMYSIL
jgi:hypothetical protein